jgi:hypothetical protein
MAKSQVSLISNGPTLVALLEGAGRAPQVEGEPLSEAWKLIEGCQALERGVEANIGMPDPRERPKFVRVSSHPRSKRKFARGWMIQSLASWFPV